MLTNLILFFSLTNLAIGQESKVPYNPTISKSSDEAQKAVAGFKIPKGFNLGLFAAEPHLANPVAFTIDEKNRFFVVETFRLHTGVLDIRSYMKWLDDDLGLKSVEDRIKLLNNIASEKPHDFQKDHDRIKIIMDRDGDGKADFSEVFADGFNTTPAGVAAGIMVRGNKTWFTCIPDLWLLEDSKNQGKADIRTSLHNGFGVHIAFIGHDLHGLTMGMDGKIYFSIGDRGTNISNPKNKINLPNMGAVFRCDQDGSNLEVFYKGLRNPQELAFDAYGNLFTVDNNSDGGDQARAIYLVEGGDSGWRFGYQFIEKPNSRGPWNAEGLWKPRFEGQPSYIIPPMINMSSGPSGLAYYPGTGFSKEYDNHFFLCDFRGAPANSGIWSFSFKKDGAGFSMQNPKQFLWSILATDVDFGPDGKMYVSDWVNGWNKPGKGRIYSLSDEKEFSNPITKEVKSLLEKGFDKIPENELIKLLGHADLRVRRESQFALAAKGSSSVTKFAEATKGDGSLFSKMHAIWGLGQIGRKDSKSVIPVLLPLLESKESEIRAQTAKVLGELKTIEARSALIAMLADTEPRVQLFALLALAKIPSPESVPAIVKLLEKNQNKDVYIRHGCVMALAAINDPKTLSSYSKNNSQAIRMGALLALRQLESQEISGFLSDSNQEIADESARAIYDIPITNSLKDLAQTINISNSKTPHNLRRVLAANRRIGDGKSAVEIAKVASNKQTPVPIAIEALQYLEKWGEDSKRDFITGLARPTPAGNKSDAVYALKSNLPFLLSAGPIINKETIRVAASLKITEIIPELISSLNDKSLEGKFRAEALRALYSLKSPEVKSLAEQGLLDTSELVKAESLRIYSKFYADYPEKNWDKILEKGTLREKQTVIEILGETKTKESTEIIKNLLEITKSGKTHPGILLEIAEAGQKSGIGDAKNLIQEDPNKPMAMAFALEGGDKDEGKNVFFQKIAVACLRCHKVEGQGGDVGPELSGIGSKQKRDYLLESIILPEKNIAKGFESLLLVLSNGKTVTGILKQDKPDELILMDFEGKLITVKKADIEEKKTGKSGMPADLYKQLSRKELRDLIEYLASLK